jgi:hypothetical protein
MHSDPGGTIQSGDTETSGDDGSPRAISETLAYDKDNFRF